MKNETKDFIIIIKNVPAEALENTWRDVVRIHLGEYNEIVYPEDTITVEYGEINKDLQEEFYTTMAFAMIQHCFKIRHKISDSA